MFRAKFYWQKSGGNFIKLNNDGDIVMDCNVYIFPIMQLLIAKKRFCYTVLMTRSYSILTLVNNRNRTSSVVKMDGSRSGVSGSGPETNTGKNLLVVGRGIVPQRRTR